MKVARYYQSGELLKVEEAEKPVATPGTAVVKMRASGVCGTELHFLEGMIPVNNSLILGHEMAGDIDSVNECGDFKPGDRVVVYNMQNCGDCEPCRRGLDSLCENPAGQMGFNLDGGFSEYVTVPHAGLIHLPEEVSYADAAVLACSGMSAVHATRIAGVSLGDRVVVNGVGGVGIMVIQVCRCAGASVIAIADSEAARADLARKAGADAVICTTDYTTVPQQVKDLTGGKGANVFMELVGTTDTISAGISSLAYRGRFMIIGYTSQNMVVAPIQLVLGELQVLSSVAAAKRDLVDVIGMAKRGLVKPIIENEYSIDQINEPITKLKERKVLGRNVIVFP